MASQEEREVSDDTRAARPILDLPKPAADYLLGALQAAAEHGLIPVEVWNRLVGEAEEFAEKVSDSTRTISS